MSAATVDRPAARTTLARAWERWVVQISLTQVVVAAVVLIGADTIYDHLGDSLGSGMFDELAHVSTALLILNLLPLRWRRPILAPALVASFLIDIDHVPQYLFHWYGLTEGTPRPYTHSLTTPVVFCLIALLWPRARVLCVGIAVGLLLHFFRDLAEGDGSGVSLLWPSSDHAFAYSHTVYLLLMAGIVVANLVRLATDPALGGAARRQGWRYPRQGAPQRPYRPGAAHPRLPDREALHHAGSVPAQPQRAATRRQPVDQP